MSAKRTPSAPPVRSSTSDLIYIDRIKDAMERGALSKLLVAYSREPNVCKAYVQVCVTV